MTTKDTVKPYFPCTKCGACCKNVRLVLPNFATKDGSCKHLSKDNECQIYDKRPLLCRIKEAKKLFQPMTDKKYIDINIRDCRNLIDFYGIEKRFYPERDKDSD